MIRQNSPGSEVLSQGYPKTAAQLESFHTNPNSIRSTQIQTRVVPHKSIPFEETVEEALVVQ